MPVHSGSFVRYMAVTTKADVACCLNYLEKQAFVGI